MSLQGWAGLGQDWVGKRGTLPTAQKAEARETWDPGACVRQHGAGA